MKLLADENIDRCIYQKLLDLGYTVEAIEEISPSIDDDAVLEHAVKTGSILITADKDFGELVYRLGRAHHGIVLVRLSGLTPNERAELVANAVVSHEAELENNFVVISHDNVRIRTF